MRTMAFVVALAAVMAAVPMGARAEEARSLEGIWMGTLSAMGQELRVVFTVSAGEGGAYVATMASPDQGTEGIPVQEAVLDGATVRFSVPAVAGSYTGAFGDDGRIVGTWIQSGLDIPLALERTAEAPVIVRPQEPQAAVSLYRSEQVTYQNAGAGISFGGTLSMPNGDGPFPAVLLISGSGPQDRNETAFGHRPFLVLSDNLTKKGIAVLRVDDRGVGMSQGNLSQATSRDLADDVLAGVAFLKSRPEIDPSCIGLLGHSEGALIAPMVAAESQDVAFIVLLAPPGLPGEEVLFDQARRINEALGETPEAIERGRRIQEAVFEVLKTEVDGATAFEKLRTVFRESVAELPEATQAELAGSLDAFVDGQARQVLTPWFRFYLMYDPAPALAKVKCPVLAIFGGKDLQVSPEVNREPVEKALAEGGNTDHEVVTFDSVNHMLQTAETGLPMEYPKITETMSPEVMGFVDEWIVKRFGPK